MTQPAISPFEEKVNNLQHKVYECREHYPEISDQLQQILGQIKKEATQNIDLYIQILATVENRLKKVDEAMKINHEINDLKNLSLQHFINLEQFGIFCQKQSNWGMPVTESHQIKNVSKVIVDKPLQQSEQGSHDFIDYRVILRCEVPNKAAESSGVYVAVRRRFNEVKQLYDTLQSQQLKPPELPPQKHFFLGGKSPFFVENRKQQLGKWLQAVASIPELVRQRCFQDFCLKNAEWRCIEQGLE